MLHKDKQGLKDDKGRLVNEKGYLLDPSGNLQNNKGYKVFSKNILEDDGDIPKVFRSGGFFRKDTQDSFS